MALDRKHKAFRFPTAMPIDANNVSFEQAFARLLVLVRTKGLPITTTTKATLHPEDLVEIITQDKEHFHGIKDDAQRKRRIDRRSRSHRRTPRRYRRPTADRDSS